MKKPVTERTEWPGFYGANQGYVEELYELYLQDPNAVDPEMKAYFEQNSKKRMSANQDVNFPKSTAAYTSGNPAKIAAVLRYADYIRSNGHLSANIYPLQSGSLDTVLEGLEKWGLAEEDLNMVPVDLICPSAPPAVKTGKEAFEYLKKVYSSTIAYEFEHVNQLDEKEWLRNKVESGALIPQVEDERKIGLFERLAEVENFEKYLHRTFVGQKRFSIEGLDAMVPLLDEVIAGAVNNGVETINIGMAHRGRLNVLAHVLGKPYEMIFAEFQHAPNKELVPSEGSIGINFGWTGDVKYHLGIDRKIKSGTTANARLTLANNPSHLEFAGAVVEGFTRAAQDDRNLPGYAKYDPVKAMAILIHGDAAFPGQGIVAETLNLSRLHGFKTGGTVHVIANNTIGFTTESMDSRSTRYASDLAKGYEIPIIHVNADDPEACLMAARLAFEYRKTFGKDFLIDLIGYRRFGHNEMDEPMTTNPEMYKLVHNHPTVKELYGKKLVSQGVFTEEKRAEIEDKINSTLKAANEKVPKAEKEVKREPDIPEVVEMGIPRINTGVPAEILKKINSDLLKWPEGFNVFNKLAKILQRRQDAFAEDGKIDWGLAETLAFASILQEGTPVRLTGQDSERGTFAQRNLVLHDSNSGEQFSPLHTLADARASFSIHNSPLSEAAVVGFEYGYNVFAPETLVLWEAQYGDFANAAQVLFDQFVAAGRAKWGQKSGLVMLLPHGYEGQGPEHSSGRVERFLTLAAENNWTVANLSSAAQYFHILRRQAKILKQESVRPLVLMTPKSLLRNPLVAADPTQLTEGSFEPIFEQPGLGSKPEQVERVVLCSGKVSIDIAEQLSGEDNDWLHVLRVEEIYPFPLNELKEILGRYPNLKEVVWVQEEPKNMGAWTFVEPRINEAAPKEIKVAYIGRRRRSSPAEGDPNTHKLEQARIVRDALTKTNRGGNDNGRN
ncbi:MULTISPECIES: 2-oxoglutarate dehydrogenase E1 component [unclassified Mesobacillus]|uniref:2-oxoglutarate dehydrogenase E1 component n=1 Tax=unclassified Mesobacillus TaxID=2675270 RepID=UPI00203C7A9F|nr:MULTISPECIES: 2-oxoglutarate dehydrogenase E1 component [unclassified Mesobacillus]MCM3121993.1 2-oxoglutarate dehydrogenase E1 component [Mesobacillus sp. MER 33]MCM3231957.1 2-oxoglutarate dehydrogenase E1 component [Mesobacillus sp. MER 48]